MFRVALVEGMEQVALSKQETIALYATLLRKDRAAAEKLKLYVSDIWEMSD